VYPGTVIEATTPRELKEKLNRVDGEKIVGVKGPLEVNRAAVEDRRVDLILDHNNRDLDYVTLKMASKKRIFISISIRKLIVNTGLKRVREIEKTRETVKVIRKFNTPFLLTSGAINPMELRPFRQVVDLSSLYGIDEKMAMEGLTINPANLIRKKFDPSYVIDGVILEDWR
jgi:ribonuclease P/MRP protein subunit RPP1